MTGKAHERSAQLKLDFVIGDTTGLSIPAHVEAFLKAGPEFLTQAFRRFGAMSADNRVEEIVACTPCPGGSTGHKFFLTLQYAKPEQGLDSQLFLKFSRDFEDERRDRQRTEMQSEVPFTALSRQPGFPIRVPLGLFADYHAESGTGLIITKRIPFGEGDIEPHRRKTLDHQTMDDPKAYYSASVTALARLAGAHKAGRLPGDANAVFPWDPVTGSADPIGYSRNDLAAELERCFNFARSFPQMLPVQVGSSEFFAKMERDAFRIQENEAAIQAYLTGDPDLRALCHWNAHIDNIWFWREAGQIKCGLIDWGRVGQISFGSALWGGLSAAHHDIWDVHFDEMLALFINQYHAAGGPLISLESLQMHLTLHMAAMGVARVLAFPDIIQFRMPNIGKLSGPYDPAFLDCDPARNCLHVYTVFLKYWQRHDFGAAIDAILA